ncbi:MAG: peptide ABC transporter substrate-binding protein [Woeseiaceae bacterium]|nr:peptide ABC transporter substrate-binding protein [Woeseiaceae bacterium]
MSRLRAFVYVVLFAAAAFVVWQYQWAGQSEQPDSSVLHRGLPADPESVDPQKARTTQAGDVLRDIGEGLLGYSPAGELVPGAAESWTISDDGLTYSFIIRDGARWSNGDPVTAGDFVFSLRRLVDPATAAFYANAIAVVASAEAIAAGELPPEELGVEAAGDRELIIRLERPTPYLLSLLTYPATFPVHAGSIALHGDDFTRPGNLLSNGAYKLDAWTPGSELALSRNEFYWNDAATAIDEVRHHVLTQGVTELNRYRAGELHITSTVPADNFAQVREEYGDQLRIAPYIGVYYYGFNLTRPPFKDNPGLREALSMAIDRDVLAEKVVGRGEEPAYSWVPPGVDNYEPRRLAFADTSQDERNARARRLMAEAGYGPDNPLQIELRYNTSDEHRRIALAVQAMWKEALGVETALINEEQQVLLANMREAEVTQVFRSSWIGDYNDAHTFLSIVESNNASNMPRYANDEFDAVMDQAARQTNPKWRRVHLEEAERVFLADHAVIPLYFYVSKHLVSPEVEGWEDNVLDYHYSQHLSLAPVDAAP